MSKKKKKKEPKGRDRQEKTAEPLKPEGEAVAPSSGGRRRLLIGAGAAIIVVALFLVIASFLPGYDDPRDEQRRCERRLRRISTAALLWSRANGGALPSGLEAMREGGFLPGEASLYTCPAAGDPFQFHKGVSWDMPGTTVYLSCPDGASHRVDQRDIGHKVVHVVNYLGVDLTLHYDALMETGTPEEGARAVRARFEKRVRDQEKVLEALSLAQAGEEKARIELVRLASERYCQARPLAVWAMGKSGDPWFRSFLQGRLRQLRGLTDDFSLACAVALLRLGDRSVVPDLIDLFEGANPTFRETAGRALCRAFSGSATPPPLRSYAPPSYRREHAEEWRTWWKARQASERK